MSIDSPKTAATISLRYVVMSYLMRKNDYTMRNYKKLLQFVIDGYAELNLYHIANIEVQYFFMDANKTISVPSDFVDWVKVGIPVNGKLKVLTNDEHMLLPRKFQDGKDVGNLDATAINQGVFFTDHFRNGKYVGGLYGMPGGVNVAYYRYDRELRQFIFTGDIPRSEVVIEYVSNGVKLSGATVIERKCLGSLRAYLAWQMVEYDDRVSDARKDRREKKFDEEVSQLRFLDSAPTIDEYKDRLRKMIKQSPKR